MVTREGVPCEARREICRGETRYGGRLGVFNSQAENVLYAREVSKMRPIEMFQQTCREMSWERGDERPSFDGCSRSDCRTNVL